MKIFLLAIGLLALSLRQGTDVEPGTIRGVVVDSSGWPAAHVRVATYGVSNIPAGKGFAWAGPVPGAVTADDGSFTITGAPSSIRYWLSASSEERNVPDLDFMLYGQRDYKQTFVDLLPGPPPGPVRVELPAAVGRFSGVLVDAHTGLPAHVRGSIKLALAESPSTFLSVGIHEDGRFSLLVPDRPVTFEVSADGCEPWRYVDPSTREAKLTVPPGQSARQTIPLRCAAAEEHSR